LFKKTKGSESKLAYLGHLLMENRHGLVVNAQVTQATGTAEREAAIDIPPRQNSCRLYDFVI
ncbi:MAG: IS5/IS1182 family transposase, partial [Rhodoferax sp.]|nr:IS5/IS1182 family transposase [Rhodoferax sp.]